jgi:hypothetical protein
VDDLTIMPAGAVCRTVEHGMAVSLFPNWQGQRQLRIPELEGDTLVLATDRPTLFAGSLKTARIIWRRATPNLRTRPEQGEPPHKHV